MLADFSYVACGLPGRVASFGGVSSNRKALRVLLNRARDAREDPFFIVLF